MGRAELERSLSTLDIWLIIFGVFVAIGVVGESLAGFLHWRRSGQLQAVQTSENLALQKDLKDTELKLEELRRLAGPRTIDRANFVKALDGKPKCHVEIWYLPDISDGFWLMNSLLAALIAAHWDVEPPTPMTDLKPDPSNPISRFIPPHMVAGAQPVGATVVAHAMPLPPEMVAPQEALMSAIASSLHGVYGSSNPSVPEGTLRIIITAKPDPIFAMPPAIAAPGQAK
jgi:uncharacterized protein YdbL (DUF1318 family)